MKYFLTVFASFLLFSACDYPYYLDGDRYDYYYVDANHHHVEDTPVTVEYCHDCVQWDAWDILRHEGFVYLGSASEYCWANGNYACECGVVSDYCPHRNYLECEWDKIYCVAYNPYGGGGYYHH